MNTAKNEVIEARPQAVTPMDMLDRAITGGANMDVLEKLMALQERWEKNQARKSFDAAIAAAKAEIPVIAKNRQVDFTSQKGRTNYRYEDLAGIAKVIDPILTSHGLSYRFNTETKEGIVTVTCILSHRDGHSESNALSAGRDESGNKNNIQAIGSTITYLQRYTLKAALGLAASTDDDGKSAGVGEMISDEQADSLRDLALQVKANMPKFLKYLGVESIPEIPALRFKEAKDALEAKGGSK